jgi:drug/metabolite transporter (DMT)-like permease
MTTPPPPADTFWIRAMPAAFVLLWSTGFIGARFGLPYAPPLTFLLVRFAIVVVSLLCAALVLRAPWPASWREVHRAMLVGVLLHGMYLGGVFFAISRGLPAAVVALIVGMQPLITGGLARPFLGERITKRQWVGLVLGLAGLGLVVAEKLHFDSATAEGVFAALLALAGITVGTLYQKRHGGRVHLVTGGVVQFVAAGLALLPLALFFETLRIDWTAAFLFALFWLSFVLSIGAISLLYLMIRRGAAAKVASLFYLTPPVTAVFTYLLFGERFGLPAIVGFGLTALAVALVTLTAADVRRSGS